MSLKKHSLSNSNWSYFQHTVTVNREYNHAMLCYSCMSVKLSKNQSWVNLLFSVRET